MTASSTLPRVCSNIAVMMTDVSINPIINSMLPATELNTDVRYSGKCQMPHKKPTIRLTMMAFCVSSNLGVR